MLNGFQFRAAKAVGNFEYREISAAVRMHEKTLCIFRNAPNFQELPSRTDSKNKLIKFFAKHNIIFPDQYSIELKAENIPLVPEAKLNRFQVVVARIATRLRRKDIAALIGSAESNISLWEQKDNFIIIPARGDKLSRLRHIMESRGIIFEKANKIRLSPDLEPRELKA